MILSLNSLSQILSQLKPKVFFLCRFISISTIFPCAMLHYWHAHLICQLYLCVKCLHDIFFLSLFHFFFFFVSFLPDNVSCTSSSTSLKSWIDERLNVVSKKHCLIRFDSTTGTFPAIRIILYFRTSWLHGCRFTVISLWVSLAMHVNALFFSFFFLICKQLWSQICL